MLWGSVSWFLWQAGPSPDPRLCGITAAFDPRVAGIASLVLFCFLITERLLEAMNVYKNFSKPCFSPHHLTCSVIGPHTPAPVLHWEGSHTWVTLRTYADQGHGDSEHMHLPSAGQGEAKDSTRKNETECLQALPAPRWASTPGPQNYSRLTCQQTAHLRRPNYSSAFLQASYLD